MENVIVPAIVRRLGSKGCRLRTRVVDNHAGDISFVRRFSPCCQASKRACCSKPKLQTTDPKHFISHQAKQPLDPKAKTASYLHCTGVDMRQRWLG